MSENILDLQRLPSADSIELGPAHLVNELDDDSCTVCSHTCGHTAAA